MLEIRKKYLLAILTHSCKAGENFIQQGDYVTNKNMLPPFLCEFHALAYLWVSTFVLYYILYSILRIAIDHYHLEFQ